LQVIDLFGRLKSAWEMRNFLNAVRANALLMELFSLYLELPEGGSDMLGHRALARFQELIAIHACDDTPVGDLAQKAGISEGHLRSLFRQRFGSSPGKYRTLLRLARARELLISSTMSVKEAAFRAGFADQLYFSRVFRHRFGISPREMIQRHRVRAISS
jgi:transcriptional regulator GlxA family with amidase domain